MTCDREMDVTAYLDGELGAEDARALRDHIAGCASCAELEKELRATTDGLAEHFQDDLERSPESPTAVSLLACADFAELPPPEHRRAVRSLARFAAVAAILIGVAVTVIFWPSENVEAAAADVVVERATSRFEKLEDVEFEIRVDLVGGNADDSKRVRLLVSKDFGMVAFQKSETGVERAIGGVKGDLAWEFDEEKGVLVTRPFDPSGVEDLMGSDPRTPEQRRQDPFGMTLMSFEMMTHFADREDAVLEETTGPFHRRIGRRAFRLTWKGGEKKTLLEALTPRAMAIVIDPRTSLIERMQYQISFVFVVLDISCEVARFDQGLPASVFDMRTHHPDAEIVAEDD